MTKQDKTIAYTLIFQAVVGTATFGWLAIRSDLPAVAWAIFVPLIVGALVAGVGSLRQRRWAIILGMIVFAVQVPIVATPSLQLYAWLGFHLDLAMTWQGQAKFGINLFGLGMLAWSAVRYCAPNNSFKPKPLRGSA
jgi:hypothetical protein